MLKRINWRLVLYGMAWLACLSGLVLLMGFIEVKKSTLKCKDVKVMLWGTDNFIEREEVDRILVEAGGPLTGQNLHDINIHYLENELKANPFIEYAKVFADMDGVIHVDIHQRKPVVRMINSANVHFYIDENGLKIPMSENFTARALVANGMIDEEFSGTVDTLHSQLGRDLYRIAGFIQADTLWNNQVEQLFVNTRGEIEIVPRVGDHKIILGTADSLEKKFRNLLIFYKQAIPKVGWDAYKTINLKYANQIVCERNIIDSAAIKKVALREAANMRAVSADSIISQDSIIN